MGYSHYWQERDGATGEAVLQTLQAMKMLCDRSPVPLAGPDGTGEPTLAENGMWFNGKGDEAYETFAFTPTPQHFAFCKTSRQPYDVVVVGCLVAAKAYLGDTITLGTDGDPTTDWSYGIGFAVDVLRDLPNPEAVVAAVLTDLDG